MAKTSSHSMTEPGLADALHSRLPLVLFLGVPLGSQDREVRTRYQDTLKRLAALSGDEDILTGLLGPLGEAGFDIMKPGRVGLAAGNGMAFFPAGQGAGFAAAVRSPKTWREAIRKAAVRTPRPLQVKGAAEAMLAVLEQDWEIAYARSPPWLYALVGFEGKKEATRILNELVAVSPNDSLAAHGPFREVTGPEGLRNDLVLWLDRGCWSMIKAEAESVLKSRDLSTNLGARAWDLLESVVLLQDAALALSAAEGRLRLEGQICGEGTLFQALDTMVGKGSRCVVGPRELGRRCPVWALSVLDWTLFTRLLPAVAELLEKIKGQWGDLIRLPGPEERMNGMAALGVCGLHPLSLDPESLKEADILASVDAFLLLEMLGQKMAYRLAGKALDSFGDMVRGGLSRLRVTGGESFTSFEVAGLKVLVALRRGTLILATNRNALDVALYLLELDSSEALPPGFLARAGGEPQRFVRMLVEGLGQETGRALQEEILAGVRAVGRVELDLKRVPAGLRLVLSQAD